MATKGFLYRVDENLPGGVQRSQWMKVERNHAIKDFWDEFMWSNRTRDWEIIGGYRTGEGFMIDDILALQPGEAIDELSQNHFRIERLPWSI